MTTNETPATAPIRLTLLSHGGGCGCKIAPGVLEQILAKTAPALIPPQLLVGIETSDDAAVYQINDTQAIVATTDFFMPVSYTHLRAHETDSYLVCRLLLEKKK